MFTTHRHRRPIAWLALFAMLALALMPTLSRTLAFTTGSSAWAQVCTPQGMKTVAVADDSGAPVRAGAQLDPCGHCTLAGDGAAPLPAAAADSLPTAGTEPPRLFLHAAHTQHAWRAAPARGPPVRS